MKLFSTSLWILFVLFFLMACPGTNPPLEDQEPATIKSILSTLPDLQFKLPRSLGGDEESVTKSKAMGDVTLLNSSNVQGVKSDAWANLKQPNPFMVMLRFGLNLIKNYALANDIAVDVPFYYTLSNQDNDAFWLGIMGAPAYPPSLVTRMGIIITGVEKDFTMHVKIHMTWDESDFNGSVMDGHIIVLNEVHIQSSNGLTDLAVVSDVTGTTTNDGNSSDLSVKVVSTLDSESGCGDFYYSNNNYGSPYSALMSTKLLADNSMAIINVSDMSNYINIAWGNDSIGGSLYATSNYYSSEYYMNQGNLAYRSYGNDTPGSYWVDDMINVSSLIGKPATLYLRNNSGTYEITDDISGSPVWQAVAGYGLQDLNGNDLWDEGESYYYGFYSKAGADWVAGDIIYGWNNGLYDQSYGYLDVFTPNIVAKDPVSMFGNSYYLTYEYPLSNLLPLAEPYNTQYKLAQEELYSNTWTWTDFEGNEQTTTYYGYDFYLDAIGDADNDDDPAVMFFNPSVDIPISNLNQRDIYFWNGSEYARDKAYFYSCENLPAYFTPPTEIGSQVDTKLNDIYTTYVQNLDYSYYENIVSSMSGSNPYFSQLD
ncbi:MAG: hypothetical protein JXR70_05765 [Spirochaetales bacterium]|nr:hypothetical protein [Spirochaetales bacterium]